MNASPSTSDIRAAVPDMVRLLMAALAPLAGLMATEFFHRPTLVGLIQPLWLRLMHVGRRFAAVRLPPVARKSRAGEVRVEGKADRPETGAPVKHAPRVNLAGRRGWLIKELGYKAMPYKLRLADLLEQPEMRAVIDAAPGFGRILRPVCWMLGISRAKATSAAELVEVKLDAEGLPVRRRAARPRPGVMVPIIVLQPLIEPVPRMTSGLAWSFAKTR